MENFGEKMTRVMAACGFMPSNMQSHYLEYVKRYADPLGRIAQAVVQFERPSSLLGDGARLSGFAVTVQAQIDASLEAVEERAPPVMQEDLLAVVRAFMEDSGEFDAARGLGRNRTIAGERCSVCAQLVTEYFVVAGATHCRTCHPRQKEGSTL